MRSSSWRKWRGKSRSKRPAPARGREEVAAGVVEVGELVVAVAAATALGAGFEAAAAGAGFDAATALVVEGVVVAVTGAAAGVAETCGVVRGGAMTGGRRFCGRGRGELRAHDFAVGERRGFPLQFARGGRNALGGLQPGAAGALFCLERAPPDARRFQRSAYRNSARPERPRAVVAWRGKMGPA